MRNWYQRLFSVPAITGKRLRLWSAIGGGSLLLMVLVFTARAFAADPIPTVFYACVNINSGTIGMTTASETCQNYEQMRSWNQQGPLGPQGPAGPPGSTQTLQQQRGATTCHESK